MRIFAIVSGVNAAAGAITLRNAENDARDLRDVLLGPIGFVGQRSIECLIGPSATRAAYERALRRALEAKPDVLLISFSGHGSTTGLAAADGLLPHSFLARWVNAIPARAKILMVDACHAQSLDPYVKVGQALGELPDRSWRSALAAAMPGTRVIYSSRATETSSDGDGRNGLFTAGVLDALQTLDGDLHQGEFISLESAFEYAREFVRASSPYQEPQATGATSNFPIARSQAWRAFGTSRIIPWTRYDRASFVFYGRRGVATRILVQFENALGEVYDSRATWVWPDRDVCRETVDLRLDFDAIDADHFSLTLRRAGCPARVRISAFALDARERVLAQFTRTIRVAPISPSRYVRFPRAG